MDNMYAIRGKLQEVYAKYSRIIDKGIDSDYVRNHRLLYVGLCEKSFGQS